MKTEQGLGSARYRGPGGQGHLPTPPQTLGHWEADSTGTWEQPQVCLVLTPKLFLSFGSLLSASRHLGQVDASEGRVREEGVKNEEQVSLGQSPGLGTRPPEPLPKPPACPHLLFWTPRWLGANSWRSAACSCLWAFAPVSLLPAIPFCPWCFLLCSSGMAEPHMLLGMQLRH